MSLISMLALVASVAGGDDAQLLQSPAPAVMVAAPVSENNVGILRSGTEIPLSVREELTTKKKQLRVGQRVQLEVASNISANGVTVIPVGSPAIGEITEVRNKGMWGKSGYIAARILSVRVGDRHIRLTGTFDDKGVTGTGGVVAAVALLPIAGFLTTGTSATIPAGSGVKAFLDEDISYRLANRPADVINADPGVSAAAPAVAVPSAQ